MSRRRYDNVDVTGDDGSCLKVLKHQADAQAALKAQQSSIEQRLEETIASSEALLLSLGKRLPARAPAPASVPPIFLGEARPWGEIKAEAEAAIPGEVGIADLLSADEIARVEQRIAILRGEFEAIHRLDAVDWCIAGVVGSVAALVDTVAVKVPRGPGMLGSPATQGGPLSNFIRDRLRTAHTPKQIAELEKAFAVPFDAPHSAGLRTPVAGLSPRTHRFQTLGHDPLLGFLFGTIDILRGTITAIDSAGRLIVQPVSQPNNGMSMFEALTRVFGHLRSDVSTPAGLPAPMKPLLQLLQVGEFGDGKYTVGQLSRLMYAKGYDFGHFLAMSVPTMMIEALVRVAYTVKRVLEGHTLPESLPLALPGRPRPPKLQTLLFISHLIATGVNAGRLTLTKNPLVINYPEWIAFAKIGFQQLKWVLFQKEEERLAHVRGKVDEGWDELNAAMTQWWELGGPSAVPPFPG